MKTGIVKPIDIRKVMRFDGSYHLADSQIYEKLIYSQKWQPLSALTSSIFTSGRNKRMYTAPQYGYPFLSNSDVVSANPFSTCKYDSIKYNHDPSGFLKEGMIVTGRVGAIGQTAFISRQFEEKKAIGSDNIIRIVCKPDVRKGYVYAFLTSRIGNLMFWKHSTGGVQPYITDKMVADIPVPVFPEEKQKEIDQLIRDAASLRDKAAELLADCVNYFNEQLPSEEGITKFFKKSIKSLNFSWAAYNNNIECDNIYSSMSNGILLSELTETVFAPPLFKHIYLSNDNGYPFMTGAELSQQCLPPYRWLSPKGVKDINDYVVEEGTLLLYKSGNTDGGILGNVFIVDKWLNGFCLSDHVIRIKMKDKKMAYWAYAFLQSKAGKRLLLSLATGAVIPFITPDRLNSLIRIPAPTSEFDTIVEKIERCLTYRSESNYNETKAISMVETEIESWDKNRNGKR